MGCMMTVRMLTRSHDVIWVNIVMHVKQAFVANSEDPVIVCINEVVRCGEMRRTCEIYTMIDGVCKLMRNKLAK